MPWSVAGPRLALGARTAKLSPARKTLKTQQKTHGERLCLSQILLGAKAL